MSIEAILGILAFLFGAGFSLKKYFEGKGAAKEKFRREEEKLEVRKEAVEKLRDSAEHDDEEIDRELERIEEERKNLHKQAAKEMDNGVSDEEIENMSDGELAELVGGLLAS